MTSTIPSKRITSIDILRGIIMVIMALDHARDYFSSYSGDPLDFTRVGTLMFFTRWITHFCAPVFVFLAGTSAFLSLGRGKTKKEMSWQLFTRGLWLVILEVTVVRFGWQFNIDYSLVIFQVIWAIGCSMIFLSLLIYLPKPVILGIGLLLIFGHNKLDLVQAKDIHITDGLWNVLHVQAPIHFANGNILFVIYPLIPWIGVMAVGYCFGAIFKMQEQQRKKWLYSIGISAILLFIIIRYNNVYGDPRIWQHQDSLLHNILAFIRCQKYPPSLDYLLMTIGPAIAVLPLLEKLSSRIGNVFTVYGRVPMFYYILHIYLLHAMALITGLLMGFPSTYFTANGALFGDKHGWGFGLGIVYLYWLAAVIILYLPCRWFMNVKMTHKKWWLSYL